ncbi:Fcf2 pre-rRNA processing domain containing protein [Elaphomyces granulatus]
MSYPSHLPENIGEDNDNISNEQTEQLLLEAETRLRSQESEVLKNSALLPVPRLSSACLPQPYIHQKDGLLTRVDTSRILSSCPEVISNTPRAVLPRKLSSSVSREKLTAGSDWFDMPKTKMTPELVRDLQLLRMRSVLDPKRHYKKEASKAKHPEFCEVGTIVQGPTEFFSARLVKKDRKGTFMEEIIATENKSRRLKTKYGDIQVAKSSGKKSYYQGLLAKRGRKRVT